MRGKKGEKIYKKTGDVFGYDRRPHRFYTSYPFSNCPILPSPSFTFTALTFTFSLITVKNFTVNADFPIFFSFFGFESMEKAEFSVDRKT